eukprot:6459151-Amphidinium_carterae.1
MPPQKIKHWQDALLRFYQAKTKTAGACGAVVSACGQAKVWQTAVHIFELAADAHLRLDAFNYNIMIGACGKAAQWRLAILYLQRMDENKGLRKDTVSYNSALSALERAGEWRRCLQLLGEMAADLVDVDAVSLTAVVTACGRRSQWPWSLSILQQAESANVAMDRFAYNVAIIACQRNARWRHALGLLDTVQHSVGVSAVACCSLMTALGKAKEWQQSVSLLQRMNKWNVVATAPCVSVAVSACARSQHWQEALQLLFDLALEPFDSSLSLEDDEWEVSAAAAIGSTIQGCSKAWAWPHAVLLVDLKQEHTAMQATATSHAAVVGSCVEVGQGADCTAVARKLEGMTIKRLLGRAPASEFELDSVLVAWTTCETLHGTPLAFQRLLWKRVGRLIGADAIGGGFTDMCQT